MSAVASTPPAVETPSSPTVPKLGISPNSRSPRGGPGRSSTPPPGSPSRSKRSPGSARASSAGKQRPSSPLTPRQKKATRSLFRELGQTGRTIHHMLTRVRQTHTVVDGTIKELVAASSSAHKTLGDNRFMVNSTKDTGGSPNLKSPHGPSGPRPLNDTELEEASPTPLALRQTDGYTRARVSSIAKSPARDAAAPLLAQYSVENTPRGGELVTRELHTSLVERGEERLPTALEIEEVVKARQDSHKYAADLSRRQQGVANKPIVEALQKLADSAGRLAAELSVHETALRTQMDLLEEVHHALHDHEQLRDEIFDPVLSNPRIKRSVLYQKTNPMAPIKLDLDDKDNHSTVGRNAQGWTGHEATEVAAEREDVARATCTKAIKAVRAAQTELALRKSSLQVSVRTSRDMVMRQRRAAKTGNFGSSEQRNTNPATRKTATNPDDQG